MTGRLHLYVFLDSETVLGIEAYSIEQARNLGAGGAPLAYCKPLLTNGDRARVAFEASIGAEGLALGSECEQRAADLARRV